MITQDILGYTLEVINVEDFKEYYYKNINCFSAFSSNSFLKALDIPPKFFKEQPDETQKELLENREVFVRESEKFFNKVILVLRGAGNEILNACKMDKAKELEVFEKLKSIEEVSNTFEHRSFIKDGYISLLVTNEELSKKGDNYVLAVDFPIMLNKPVVVHDALYSMPTETSITPIDHVHYVSETVEVDFSSDRADYVTVKDFIEDKSEFLSTHIEESDNENILREADVVALALVETEFLPKSQKSKIEKYIEANTPGILTTGTLEKLVLDFDQTVKGYKQVTNLRNVSGRTVLEALNSDSFRETLEELEEASKEEV